MAPILIQSCGYVSAAEQVCRRHAYAGMESGGVLHLFGAHMSMGARSASLVRSAARVNSASSHVDLAWPGCRPYECPSEIFAM